MACRAAKLRRLLPPIDALNTPVFKCASTTASILDNVILVVGCKHSYAADLKLSFFICQQRFFICQRRDPTGAWNRRYSSRRLPFVLIGSGPGPT